MRKTVLWLFCIVIAALIQSTWLRAVRVGGVLPNLPLLLVVFFAINDGAERAMFTGLLSGIFEDVAGGLVLGHSVFCNVLVGYLSARVANRLLAEHPAVKAGLILTAALLYGLLYTIVLKVQKPDVQAISMLASVVVPSSMYTTIVSPVVLLVLNLLFQRRLSHQGGMA